MLSFMILGYVYQILDRDFLIAPPYPWAVPKRSILHRVENMILADTFLSSKYLLYAKNLFSWI